MKSFARFTITTAAVVGACFLAMPAPADCQELPSPSALDPKTTTAETSAPVAGGMKVYIDPHTGRFTKSSTTGVPMQLSPAESNAVSTSHQGLVETLSPRSGGGAFVHLQGRFQNSLIATIDEQGKLVIQHLDADAVSAGAK